MSAAGSRARARAPRISSARARAQIVAAADRLLRDRRYRDLTVDDVMREAGLARTVFYRHFDSLAALVLGLLEELVRGVLGRAGEGEDPSPELLRAQLELLVDAFARHGAILLALEDAAHDDPAVERAVRALGQEADRFSAAMIERAVELGAGAPLPAADVARALNGMNSRFLLDLVAEDLDFDREAALAALLEVWMRTTWPSRANQ